jgi:hypothetical protein
MKTIVKSCKVETLKACGRKAATTLLTLLTFLTLQRIPASGQTNLPANPSQSFFQSVGGYLTSINTNYSFASNTFEVSIGAGESGPILANYVAAQYDLGKWDIAAQARNAGVAGVIQTAEVGGGYSVIRSGDTKLQIGALAGYDWNKSALLFEPQLVLRKKVTKNTFFETGISLPEWTTGPLNKTPAFFIGTGFTY